MESIYSNLTDLKSDDYCGYDQSIKPFNYDTDPIQNKVEFKVGHRGIPVDVGIHTPAALIDIDSFLKDLDTPLTRCYNKNCLYEKKNINEYLKNIYTGPEQSNPSVFDANTLNNDLINKKAEFVMKRKKMVQEGINKELDLLKNNKYEIPNQMYPNYPA